MGLRLRTGRVAVAVLAAAVLAVLVPGAGFPATPPPTIAELRYELLAAIAAEKRALELLAKTPPRDGAAELQLDRSLDHLDRIRSGLKELGLPDWIAGNITAAAGLDGIATQRLPPLNQAVREIAINEIEDALEEKQQVLGELVPTRPVAGAAQCADGRDNDGDHLVDARFESGCTSSKDASEGSALTCTLRSATNQVTGSCSGTFAKIELVAPSGVTFDRTRMPASPQAYVCRYSSPQRLECLMDDGASNPRHVVDVRFKLKTGSAARLRARIRDFAGRVRTFTPAAQPGPARADLHVSARIDTAFLDRNGVGRVSGTLVVANDGPSEASGFRLLLSSNRVDSARAAELTFLPCAKTDTGVSCTGPRVARGLSLAYAFALPVSGAGQLTVTFELSSATGDPSPANNRATVQAELRPSP